LPLVLPLFALLVFVAGCVSTPDIGKTREQDIATMTREMMVAGFEDIDSHYITPANFKTLALAGLGALIKIDPDIAVQGDDTIELKLKDSVIDSIKSNPDWSGKDWGLAVANAINTARIRSELVGKIPVEALYNTIFPSITAELDPFSHYAGAAEAQINEDSRDGFGGIGARIALEDGQVRVVSVIHYTPAERLGIRSGDIITKIDDKSVNGLSEQEVVALLRGPVDSLINVTIKRADMENPLVVSLNRAHVVPETVNYERYKNIAYLHIYGFNSGTADSVQRAIREMQIQIKEQIKGYILDLRENPGGLLSQAVAVSNLFLDKGVIVSTHGRHPDSHQYFEATKGDVAHGLPIVVLINGDTASAAEILAAALQDNGRAVVIGSNSYGKGTVQTILPMPNNGELALTWARFHAPSGYALHHLGILPNICMTAVHSVTNAITKIEHGTIEKVPVARRNALKPDDADGVQALRDTCPRIFFEASRDVDMAIHLLDRQTLWASANQLAQPTPATQQTGAKESPTPE